MGCKHFTMPTLTAVVLVLAGCGAGASSDDGQASDSAAFPATVDTKFGEVTVEAPPERIVALGWGDAETVLELGLQPVGASDWLDFGGEGVGPWAEGMYDEPPEIIETLEPSYEAVAALEPDLILDVRSSGDQDRYDRLSSIATTIGVSEGGDNYLTGADEQMMMIATAVGKLPEGEKLLSEVDDAFEAAAEKHPEWEGKTVSAATRSSEGWGAYIAENNRVAFMEQLGFQQNPELEELPPSAEGFSVDISSEQLDLLDADLIVAFPIWIDTTEITEDAQFKAIPAVADDRAVVIDGDLSSAYSLGTVTAKEYALEEMLPLIEDALD